MAHFSSYAVMAPVVAIPPNSSYPISSPKTTALDSVVCAPKKGCGPSYTQTMTFTCYAILIAVMAPVEVHFQTNKKSNGGKNARSQAPGGLKGFQKFIAQIK